MEAIKTETTNTIFTKEGCFDLPGTRYIYEDGTPGIETCWQLTEEEIQQAVRKVFQMMKTVERIGEKLWNLII